MPGKALAYKYFRLKEFLTVFLMFFCVSHNGFAQTKTYLSGNITGNYEDVAVLGIGSLPNITAPIDRYNYLLAFRFFFGNGVLNGSTTHFTTMTAARSVVVASLTGANTYLQFRTSSNDSMPAGKSVYFKIGTPITSSGLAVSVGGLLGAGANKPIEGRLYKFAGNYITGISNSENSGISPATDTFKTELLIDKSAVWYVGIHPVKKSARYNSARLKLRSPAAALTVADIGRVDMNVHNAFYYSTSGSACNINPMFATRGEVNGISLDLGSVLSGLSLDTIIANPQYAIDSNSATYCAFRSGLLSLGALSSVSQSYLFDHTTAAGDGLRLQLSIPNTLLSVALLNNISIDFYRNDSLKSSDTLGKRLLGLDLLTLPLLSDGYRAVDAVLRPGTTFDRATLNLGGGILSVSLLGAGIRVHEVAIAPSVPAITVQPMGDTVCQGDAIALSVTAAPATSYQWQLLSGGTWSDIASATSGSYTTTSTLPMNGNNYRVRVTGSGGCPQTVNSSNALISVKAKPVIPAVTFGP